MKLGEEFDYIMIGARVLEGFASDYSDFPGCVSGSFGELVVDFLCAKYTRALLVSPIPAFKAMNIPHQIVPAFVFAPAYGVSSVFPLKHSDILV